ncbi:MAG: hypothetical protein KF866_07435 [Phycisphaeraceae bacterium]|nr:hypothetical protein [Phycisphaeraceae bacterium]
MLSRDRGNHAEQSMRTGGFRAHAGSSQNGNVRQDDLTGVTMARSRLLSVKELKIYSDNYLLYLRGRRPGVLGALTSLLGFSATTTMAVDTSKSELRSQRLSHDVRSVIPFSSIQSIEVGQSCQGGYLIAAAIMPFIGFGLTLADEIKRHISPAALIVAGFVSALLFLSSYVHSRRLFISVATGSAQQRVRFKKATLGNVTLNRETLDAISNTIAAELLRKAV